MSMVKNSLNLFVNLEKHRAIQSQIHFIIINQDEITNQAKINKQILYFHQSLFLPKVQIHTDKIKAYLENKPLSKFTNEKTLSCEGIISKDEVFKSLKSMENNKSPGIDGLSKEFYECLSDKIEKSFLSLYS